jgi:hypothetical protein
VSEEDRALAHLGQYRTTRDEHDLFAAFGAAKDGLSSTDRDHPEYVTRLRTLVVVMFDYFQLTGGFSVLDCAVEMSRRHMTLTGRAPGSETWQISHPTWGGGTFGRGIDETAWRLHHPDGRESRVWKDWTNWDGVGWPMGWNVRRPDGVVIQLDEDQWGDDWHLDGARTVELPIVDDDARDGWRTGLKALDDATRTERFEELARVIEQRLGRHAEVDYETDDDGARVRVRVFVGAVTPGQARVAAEAAHHINCTLPVGKVSFPGESVIAFEMTIPGETVTPEAIGQAAAVLAKLADSNQDALGEALIHDH